MSSYIGHFLLLCRVYLQVFFFVVFSYYKTIVDWSARTNKKTAKFLELFEDVRSCYTFTHANDSSFWIPPQRTLVRFILMKTWFNKSSSLSLIEQFCPNTNESTSWADEIKSHLVIYSLTTNIHSFSIVHLVHY